ncbi:MAG: hypothetical protein B7Z74_04055 [Deltaproteobacteria bacterium 21-66-5]|nr:MAG: hypothetical protein B7Z74_04055 [Deltaproteobacteria bacterium 21-66-5]
MNYDEMRAALKLCFDNRLNPCLVSPPGFGKTTMAHHFAQSINYRAVHVNCTQQDGIEWGGMPYVTENGFKYVPMDMVPFDGKVVLILDEIDKAQQMTMNALAEMLNERTWRNMPLSPDLFIVCTANRKEDRAGSNPIPTHVRNRLVFYDLDVELESAAKLMNQLGWHPDMIAYHRFKGGTALYSGDVTQRSIATMRSWDALQRTLPDLLANETLLLPTAAGLVGDGYAEDFYGFLKIIKNVPDPKKVLQDPNKAPIPDDPALMYSLMSALARIVTKATRQNFFIYLTRVSENNADVAVAGAKDAKTRIDKLQPPEKFELFECQEGIKWAATHAPLFL